jgi:hypothetical protein
VKDTRENLDFAKITSAEKIFQSLFRSKATQEKINLPLLKVQGTIIVNFVGM